MILKETLYRGCYINVVSLGWFIFPFSSPNQFFFSFSGIIKYLLNQCVVKFQLLYLFLCKLGMEMSRAALNHIEFGNSL